MLNSLNKHCCLALDGVIKADEHSGFIHVPEGRVPLKLNQLLGIKAELLDECVQNLGLCFHHSLLCEGRRPLRGSRKVGVRFSLDNRHLSVKRGFQHIRFGTNDRRLLLVVPCLFELLLHLSQDDAIFEILGQFDLYELQRPAIRIHALQCIVHLCLQLQIKGVSCSPQMGRFILRSSSHQLVADGVAEHLLILQIEFVIQMAQVCLLKSVLQSKLQVKSETVLCPRVQRIKACTRFCHSLFLHELKRLRTSWKVQKRVPRTNEISPVDVDVVRICGLREPVVFNRVRSWHYDVNGKDACEDESEHEAPDSCDSCGAILASSSISVQSSPLSSRVFHIHGLSNRPQPHPSSGQLYGWNVN
mmetsp:Transcript_60904/g.161746  ORF Transcript_60904/g.161746 Transcript_60904/m.161746 type:complete len:360 (+) Transcript_60904:253-1332(+)